MNGPCRHQLRRVRMPYVERLFQSLSTRDWAVIETVSRFRLVSGAQLERLHFHELGLRSRGVVRGRVLKRLVDGRVLQPCERRIGTARGGSAGLAYTLDSAGQRLVQLRANREAPGLPLRRPRLPGDRFIAHTLAIAELFVALTEYQRLRHFTLDTFAPEAAWPSGNGGWVKPDAYLKLQDSTVADHWWYEADLATESLPTIRAKLEAYLGFVHRGQTGPEGVVPRVAFGVPTAARQLAIQREINRLPPPADLMFQVSLLQNVAGILVEELFK